MLTCKNCGNEFSGKFCNDCGQPGDTFNIDRNFVIHELRKTFIHFWADGLFYTAKSLFTNPGKAIEEYLQGKRVKHIKPFTFLILIVGLYVLLSQYFHLSLFTTDIEGHKSAELNAMLYTHYTQVQLLLLVCYSSFSVLFFSYRQYNFYEFIVINTYLVAQRLIISVVITIPILVLLKDPGYIKTVVYITSIPGHLLMIWTYCYLFKNENVYKVIAKSILILLFSIFAAALVIGIVILLL